MKRESESAYRYLMCLFWLNSLLWKITGRESRKLAAIKLDKRMSRVALDELDGNCNSCRFLFRLKFRNLKNTGLRELEGLCTNPLREKYPWNVHEGLSDRLIEFLPVPFRRMHINFCPELFTDAACYQSRHRIGMERAANAIRMFLFERKFRKAQQEIRQE